MRIFHNFGLKSVALLVALVLWGATQGVQSIEESLDVPIAIEDLSPDLVLVGQSATEVNLQMVGSRAAVRRAERQLTRFPISLRGMTEGEVRLAIEEDRISVPRGAQVVARSPSSVAIRLEPRARKRVPVRADLIGEPPKGYRLARIEVQPEEVLLEGAQGALRKLREALTDRIELGALQAPLEQEVRLALAEHVWRVNEEGPIRVFLDVRPVRRGSGRSDGGATSSPARGTE